MPELESPELDTREWATREFILPILPDEASQYDDLHPDDVQAAKSILAQEYVEHGNIWGILKILAAVGLWDALYPVPVIAYGMILSAYGSIFLAAPAMHTPASLAGETISRTKSLEKLIRSNAEESVKTNIGIIPLIGGFVIQFISTINAPTGEVFRNDLLSGAFPPGYAFLVYWILLDLILGGPIRGVLASIISR